MRPTTADYLAELAYFGDFTWHTMSAVDSPCYQLLQADGYGIHIFGPNNFHYTWMAKYSAYILLSKESCQSTVLLAVVYGCRGV